MEVEPRVANRYKVVGPKIGRGSFGVIYGGTDIVTGEKVAIKFENVKVPGGLLMNESRLYKILEGGSGIPNMKWFGVEGRYHVLVMDLLGDSLDKLFKNCGKKMSLKSVLMLADQMIDRIEHLHSKSYIHRDIKPDNFVMGRSDENEVYIIDFGLSNKYRNPATQQHIPYRTKPEGRFRIYWLCADVFFKGKGIKEGNSREKLEKIKKSKISTSIEALCKDYPIEFASYFHYCRSLQFQDKPDYGYLKRLFSGLFFREGYKLDYVFDWTIVTFQHLLNAAPPARRVLGAHDGTSSRITLAIANGDQEYSGSKPVGRSSMYLPSSITTRLGINAGSILKQDSPAAKVSAATKDTMLSISEPMGKSSGLPRQATGSRSHIAALVADESELLRLPSIEAQSGAVQKTSTKQSNTPIGSSEPKCKSSGRKNSTAEHYEFILKGFKSLCADKGKRSQH